VKGHAHPQRSDRFRPRLGEDGPLPGDRSGKSSGRGVECRPDRITNGLEVDTTMDGNGLVE
jgi:hypothetical protein